MMKRLTRILIACLCTFIALPPAFAATKYNEAPVLAALVKAGKLPAVDKRLPENPLVVPGDAIGQYGGVWRRGFLGPSDFNGVNRLIYDVLARFGPDGFPGHPARHDHLDHHCPLDRQQRHLLRRLGHLQHQRRRRLGELRGCQRQARLLRGHPHRGC